jgi:hypothetical protein
VAQSLGAEWLVGADRQRAAVATEFYQPIDRPRTFGDRGDTT